MQKSAAFMLAHKKTQDKVDYGQFEVETVTESESGDSPV